jgi:Icc-related predicted phosphoesterase
MKEKENSKKIKIAAVGDIHIGKNSRGMFNEYFALISELADVLVLCGDITQRGIPSDVEILAQEISSCKIPILGVLGNHDHEGGKMDEISEMLARARVTILDGDSVVEKGVGFAGIKGFCGGFGNHILTSFGEKAIKDFVQETVNENLKLERALDQLSNTEKKVVIMHYAPIAETLKGESPEIFPFLGSSRFEDTINRFDVNVVFHGHAHHATHAGATNKNIPVFNVAYPIMYNINPAQAFLLYEV